MFFTKTKLFNEANKLKIIKINYKMTFLENIKNLSNSYDLNEKEN